MLKLAVVAVGWLLALSLLSSLTIPTSRVKECVALLFLLTPRQRAHFQGNSPGGGGGAAGCAYGDWSDWSVCVLCSQSRARTSNPITCPNKTQTQDCPGCKQDCVWDDWKAWSACSLACGGGKRNRTRAELTPKLGNGKECPPPSYEEQTCNTQLCSCQYTEWSSYGSCQQNCKKVSTRTKLEGQTGCLDLPLADAQRTVDCVEAPCAIDCTRSDWTMWGECDKDCGGGKQQRTRTIISPALGAGSCVGNNTESRPCNEQVCATPCVWGTWSDWSKCDKDCGPGIQVRTRSILKEASGGKEPCKPTESTDTQTCKSKECPVDCVWNSWLPWGECSKECGGGTRVRVRTVKSAAQFGGVECAAADGQSTEPCNTQMCIPQDCQWAEWGAWSTCDKPCGTGAIRRIRTKAKEEKYGGKECTGSNVQELPCNTVPCAEDCYFTEWSEYGACSVECSTGTQTRTRTKVDEKHGGVPCSPIEKLTQVRNCNTQACPVDCTWNEWSPYSECDADCGGGTQQRTRSKNAAQFGGKDCEGPATMSVPCNTQACPVDCSWNSWSKFGTCDKPCGGGLSSRTRTKNEAVNGGKLCLGDATESIPCNVVKCANGPVDCSWNDWGFWGECSKTCGGGTTRRSRTSNDAQNGGAPCDGGPDDTGKCNTQECPADCTWGPWSPFSDCSAKCDGGIQTRTRVPSTQEKGGAPCKGQAEQVIACNIAPCSFDGVDPCLGVRCPSGQECNKQGENAGRCVESTNYPIDIFYMRIELLPDPTRAVETTITEVENIIKQAAITYVLHNSYLTITSTHNGGPSYTIEIGVTETKDTISAIETFRDSMAADLANNGKFRIVEFEQGETRYPVSGPPPTSGKIPTANSGFITGILGPELGPEEPEPYFGFLKVSSQALAIGILIAIIATPLVIIAVIIAILLKRNKAKAFEEYEQL